MVEAELVDLVVEVGMFLELDEVEGAILGEVEDIEEEVLNLIQLACNGNNTFEYNRNIDPCLQCE